MSKKANHKKGRDREETIENYYALKTEAVDRLLHADSAQEVSREELQKYQSRKSFHIPAWVKIFFVKFWFSGAICYFFLWGLGTYITGLDLMFVLAVALGISVDLMVNHILHHFEPEEGAYDKWMMVPYRKFWTIFLNALYSGIILFCIVQAYKVINTLIVGDLEAAQTVAVPVEPILFGLLYTGFDMLFITIRNTFVKIFRDAEAKVSGKQH